MSVFVLWTENVSRWYFDWMNELKMFKYECKHLELVEQDLCDMNFLWVRFEGGTKGVHF